MKDTISHLPFKEHIPEILAAFHQSASEDLIVITSALENIEMLTEEKRVEATRASVRLTAWSHTIEVILADTAAKLNPPPRLDGGSIQDALMLLQKIMGFAKDADFEVESKIRSIISAK